MEKEKLSLEMPEQTFNRLANAMKRDMFFAGLCFGASLAGLVAIRAYGAITGVIVGTVVYVALRGWPWED